MPLKIEINSQEVINKSGMGNNGRSYSINEQVAYVHKPGEVYPEKIKVRIPDGQIAYPNGFYELSAESFFVGRYGSLEVNPVLTRISDIPKKTA